MVYSIVLTTDCEKALEVFNGNVPNPSMIFKFNTDCCTCDVDWEEAVDFVGSHLVYYMKVTESEADKTGYKAMKLYDQ